MRNLSESLVFLMHKHQLTVSTLAETTKLSPIVILRMLTGQLSDPRLSTIHRIATAFGLNTSQFIGGSFLNE